MPKKLTAEEFIKRAKGVHGNKYDYSLANYINDSTKIKIICSEHGIFEQLPGNHIRNKQGCPVCSGKKKYSLEDFIKKAKETHGDNKYDYSKVNYVNNKTKIEIICPEHGPFFQIPKTHLSGSNCPKCSQKDAGLKRRITKEEFAKKAKKIHGDKYGYNSINYETYRGKKVEIICPKHGTFFQDPRSHLRGCGCPFCNESKGEKEIKNFLENKNIKFFREYKFKKCKDKKLLPFDFYIPSKNLLIEYQGEQHYKNNSFKHHDLKLQKHHDWLKRKFARDNNIKLLTIPYWELKNIKVMLKEELS